MPDAAASRVVRASPGAVTDLLTPERVIAFEGRFVPKTVTETDGTTVVETWPHGRLLAPQYEVEQTPAGYAWRRCDDGRRLIDVETELEVEAIEDGALVTLRSTVESRVGVPILDRLVARRRRRTLSRLLDRIELEVA